MMNLNQPGALTLEAVAALIASEDDTVTRQLCVKKDGGVLLIDASLVHDMASDLLFRVESWGRGNGYCGPEAAQSEPWVRSVHDTLAANWPVPSNGVGGLVDMV